MSATIHERQLGVYLHVPFCSVRCDYCAFATWTDKAELMGDYVDAVLVEIERARCDGQLVPASTLFLGGGTPSLLSPRDISRLIAAVELAPFAEVTVECNPESMTPELMRALRAVGVTRISIGVQSLHPHVLSGLGRPHVAGSVERALHLIEEGGFESFNVDLVFGGAGETAADWAATLSGVLEMSPRPPHISAYALTVEPGTPLAATPDRHPDDDAQASRYEVLDSILAAKGYEWYEISNYAMPGHACRHNQSCWRQEDYLGFGCAAHSHVAGHRFANVWNIERYLERIRQGRSPIASEDFLDEGRRAAEALELGIRTAAGVTRAALSAEDLDALGDLVQVSDDRIMLTLRGRLLCNEVSLRLRTRSALTSFA
ncbi:MAG TPA: radical SAM family heme chaperone HemW [Acidimicrobiales bacterium]